MPMNFQQIKSSRYMQYLSCITASMCVSAVGMANTWTSPSLLILQSDHSPIGRPITDEEGSWIVSIYTLSSIPSPILAAWVLDRFGRKKTLILAVILMLIEWALIIFGRSYELILAARSIGGIGWGMTVMSCAIYISEIAEVDIRGKLSTYMTLMRTVGTVIVHTVGPYISYVSLGIICTMFPILCFCSFYFLPESPYYLVKSGDMKRAKKDIIKLSSNSADEQFIDKRMTLIQKIVETDMENKGTFWELFSNKKYAFSLFLLFGIKTLHIFNGSGILGSYLQTIIELTDTGLSSQVTSIIVGCIELPAVYVSSLLVDRLGRKPLLIISALGCAISHVGIGIYFYFQDSLEKDTSSLAWLPTAGVVLFWISNALGIMPLPFVLLGELFPTNIKANAAAVAAIYGSTVGFFVSKYFKQLSNVIGIYKVFYIFAGFCTAGAIFAFVFLPETKGMNFDEIQELMKRRGKRNKKENKDLTDM